MNNIYVCDTETTGLDPKKHNVIEVCFWRLSEPESKTWWIKPLDPLAIEDSALKVNGHKREDILWSTQEGRDRYREASVVLPEIEEFLMSDGCSTEERVFIGQNPEFDYKFLTELWKKTGNENSFPFGYWRNKEENVGYTLDTIQLVRFIDVILGKKRKFYNLGNLVKDFGIKKAQAHRADGDVQMTKDLFEKIRDGFAESASAFKECYKE